MNAIERNAVSSELGSGVYSRDRMAAPTSANVADDDALESLVRRASSRPPRPLVELDDYPSIPPLGAPLVPSEVSRVTTPLDPVTVTEPSLSSSLKAAIVAPWLLLGIGAVAVVLAWPRSAAPAPLEVAAGARSETVALAAGAPAVDEVAAIDSFSLEEAEALEGATEVIAEEIEASSLAAPASALPPTTESPVAAAAAPANDGVAPVEAAVTAAVAAETLAQADTTPVAATDAPVAATSEVAAETAAVQTSNATFTMQHVLSRIEAGPTAATTAAAPAAIPDRPSRVEVAAALRRVHPAVDACTTQVGSATVRIVVANDGSVTSASATGAFAGTPEGACMADAVRSARFPAFAASSMTIAFPFALR